MVLDGKGGMGCGVVCRHVVMALVLEVSRDTVRCVVSRCPEGMLGSIEGLGGLLDEAGGVLGKAAQAIIADAVEFSKGKGGGGVVEHGG